MTAKLLMTSLALMSMNAFAEPYVAASLGWTFNQKLSGIKGDENVNYPDAPDNLDPDTSLYTGTKYSDIKLKDVLQGGVKAGYYFESLPNFGIELEANYSQPNMKKQNVTLSNSNFSNTSLLGSSGYDQNYFTEDQLPAKVKLFQLNFNGLYRYQGLKEFVPYLGGGPSINIIRITGTGESGHIVDPNCDPITECQVSYGPRVNTTSVNIGANFKIGAEYRFDKNWGMGAEYHYNWVPVDIKHFRSANNLSADLEMQSVSLVLTRHF